MTKRPDAGEALPRGTYFCHPDLGYAHGANQVVDWVPPTAQSSSNRVSVHSFRGPCSLKAYMFSTNSTDNLFSLVVL